MQLITNTERAGCFACQDETSLDFDFTMAFQPIVDIENKTVYAQEALARGLNGEPAGQIIERVNQENMYNFDQTCRVKAVRLASQLKINSYLNINFMPNAVYHPKNCLRTTIKAATENDFPLDKIVFEFTENEQIIDKEHLRNIISEYKKFGFKTAIDDFGAGYAGLNLLSVFQPDIIKLDMELIRDIDGSAVKRSIVKSIVQVARDLNIEIIAEGIETAAELDCLIDFDIKLFQGYYFARPAFESLAILNPEFDFN